MTSLVLSAIAAVLFAVWVALTLWDKRTQRRLYAAQRESERRWPMAVEDFTEEDELAPADPALAPGYREARTVPPGYSNAAHAGDESTWDPPSRPHTECVDRWADGEFHRVHDRCRQAIVKARGW